MLESKRKVIDSTVKEFDALPLSNGYRLILRLKQFPNGEALTLNLYHEDQFVKNRSIAVPLDKISELAKALRSIKRQLQIVERLCGNCCFWRTDSCFYGRNAPILKSDKFSGCPYFTPKSLRFKIKSSTDFGEFAHDLAYKKIERSIGNGKYVVK